MERHGTAVLERTAEECMTATPTIVPARELATHALALMEERRITSLPVIGDGGRLLGVVHLHDLWKTEMI
jgi:arabinose-5-phosphate isomerase